MVRSIDAGHIEHILDKVWFVWTKTVKKKEPVLVQGGVTYTVVSPIKGSFNLV